MALSLTDPSKTDVVAGQKLYAANYEAVLDAIIANNAELTSKSIVNEGAQSVAGVKTFSDIPVFSSGANMGSAAITAVLDPTADQEAATKKYVDDNGNSNGNTPTALDSESNTMLKAHAYLAQTSGFVTASANAVTNGGLTGYVGATTDPEGAGTAVIVSVTNNEKPSVSFFVPNGMYFELVQGDVSVSIIWTSLVSGGAAPVDQD